MFDVEGQFHDDPLYSGPDPNWQRVKSQLSKLELGLKLRREKDDQE